jgi:hypothetical protein
VRILNEFLLNCPFEICLLRIISDSVNHSRGMYSHLPRKMRTDGNFPARLFQCRIPNVGFSKTYLWSKSNFSEKNLRRLPTMYFYYYRHVSPIFRYAFWSQLTNPFAWYGDFRNRDFENSFRSKFSISGYLRPNLRLDL